MGRRIFAIAFIYACTAAAWLVLSGITLVRTETQDVKLRGSIGELWGTEQTQLAPTVASSPAGARQGTSTVGSCAALKASDIKVDMKLDHRRKGLLWYSTYNVTFSGRYEIANTSNEAREMRVEFTFPSVEAIYDDFRLAVGGSEVEDVDLNLGKITRDITVAGGAVETLEISYKSQGLDRWSYDFGVNVSQVKNFSLVLTTDFDEIDFPSGSISPTNKEKTSDGWKLLWEYSNLLTGVKIGMVTPQRLNPGPWASKVTAAAPVSLFLFFFLLFVLTTIRKVNIHPMNYFFVGVAFFSFHLLLSYLVDHISIHLAFWICSGVSIFLVISYMRLVVGPRMAFVEIAVCQLVYLVFFSYTFFFEGYTGLAITILCICTLFVVMQTTGKVDWDKVLAKGEMPMTPKPKSNKEVKGTEI